MFKRKDTKLIVESWRNFINDAKCNDKKDVLEEGWKGNLLALAMKVLTLAQQASAMPPQPKAPIETVAQTTTVAKTTQEQLKNKLEEFAKSLEKIKDKSFEDLDGFGADTNTKELIYYFIIGVQKTDSIRTAYKAFENSKNEENSKQLLKSINVNMRLFDSIREYMPEIFNEKFFKDEGIKISFVGAALTEDVNDLEKFNLEKFIKNFKEEKNRL